MREVLRARSEAPREGQGKCGRSVEGASSTRGGAGGGEASHGSSPSRSCRPTSSANNPRDRRVVALRSHAAQLEGDLRESHRLASEKISTEIPKLLRRTLSTPDGRPASNWFELSPSDEEPLVPTNHGPGSHPPTVPVSSSGAVRRVLEFPAGRRPGRLVCPPLLSLPESPEVEALE